jgi:hypothetical protein
VAGDAVRRLVVVTGPADGPDALSAPVRAGPAVRLSLAEGEVAGRASLRLIGPLSLVLAAGAPAVGSAADREPAPRAAVRAEPPPVWLYWEGACPEWIRRCQATLVAHAPGVRLLRSTRVHFGDADLFISNSASAARSPPMERIRRRASVFISRVGGAPGALYGALEEHRRRFYDGTKHAKPH